MHNSSLGEAGKLDGVLRCLASWIPALGSRAQGSRPAEGMRGPSPAHPSPCPASQPRSLLPVNKPGADRELASTGNGIFLKRQLNEQPLELRPILMSFLFSTNPS